MEPKNTQNHNVFSELLRCALNFDVIVVNRARAGSADEALRIVALGPAHLHRLGQQTRSQTASQWKRWKGLLLTTGMRILMVDETKILHG